jgi:hypothetical protein
MIPVRQLARNAFLLAGFALIPGAFPVPALADIYRWVDESGGFHFTDDLSSIPERNRGQAQDILKTPPPSGKPGLSTIGGSSPPPSAPVPSSPAAVEEDAPLSPESREALAEQLRAKIAAKEQFIGRIDAKRSNILNPLGNRIVSPEDLELYRKYTAELPADRQRLQEIEAGIRSGVN